VPDGLRGGALEFDGASNWIECESSWDRHPRDGLTIVGWFKVRGNDPGLQTLVGKADVWWLQRDGGKNTVTFGIHGPQTTGTDRGRPAAVVSVRPLEEGQWHHLAGVYDGKRLALYLDGREAATITATGPVSLTTASLTLGDTAESRGSWFNGWMDEVQLHHRALSANEIAASYREAAK
jgi:hypothetical protein